MKLDITEDKKEIADLSLQIADEEMLAMSKAGVHIGHVSTKTNPKMVFFIYGQKGNLAIFDLEKTKVKLNEAENFLKKTASENKVMLFAGTKPAARKFVQKVSESCDCPNVTGRWIGGTLTNFKNILGRVQRLEQLLREKAEGGFGKYTKKEVMKKEEEINHLEQTFGGLRKLKRLPDVLVLADIDEDHLAMREALRMKIPVVGITNSNTDPTLIAYPIPANDNSLPSLEYIFGKFEKAIQSGKQEIKPVAPAEAMEIK